MKNNENNFNFKLIFQNIKNIFHFRTLKQQNIFNYFKMPYFHYGKKTEPGTIFQELSEKPKNQISTAKRASFCALELPKEPIKESILPPKTRRLTVTSLLSVPEIDSTTQKKTDIENLFQAKSDNQKSQFSTIARSSFSGPELPILPSKSKRFSTTCSPVLELSQSPEPKKIEVKYVDDGLSYKLANKRESGVSKKISESNYNGSQSRCCNNVSSF